jgi:hypothetical protein
LFMRIEQFPLTRYFGFLKNVIEAMTKPVDSEHESECQVVMSNGDP